MVPKAQSMHQHNYHNSDEVVMNIIKAAQDLMDDAMQQYTTLVYSLKHGKEESMKIIFARDGSIK